ncbi:ATP-binding protein [Streptomyces sp. NRRL S-87]|uniref:AAA family ATPase n=1 Tax=Streptomyces sp. NRRL S-87 TaxID=1463920 RepID=UPI0004C11D3D|nr:hypothetical protein [Streptomyces sp. NRRL S-87]
MNTAHGRRAAYVAAPEHVKPDRLFDRDDEWAALGAFADDPTPAPRLGMVRGRPRQGKSLLLEAMARSTGGLYFCGQQATEAETLRRLRAEYERHAGAQPDGPAWQDWGQALDALFALGDDRPYLVVVDSFPALVRSSPTLPAALRAALHRLEVAPRTNRVRLVLSGETGPVMGRLFTVGSHLHALAGLRLEVRPLDYRRAARLWGLDDPELALLVHAVVGGTPAYRYDYVSEDAPRDLDDFDDWICRTVLSPRTPLFAEARHLVDEEVAQATPGICHSVLTALATGRTTQGEVATFLGQQLADVSRALTLLRDHGVLRSEPDGLRPAVTRHRITDQLLAFEHAVARPRRTELEQTDAASVWRAARDDFTAYVVEPQFGDVCRQWAARFAGPALLGADGPVTAVYGSPADPGEPDRPTGAPDATAAEVVVRSAGDTVGPPLALGLARWGTPMDAGHLERLRALAARSAEPARAAAGDVRLLLFGTRGFSDDLHAAADRGEVVLVDPPRLYAP